MVGIVAVLSLLREHQYRLFGVANERSEGLLVETLQAIDHKVFPVSPCVSARARERYQAAAKKNDRFDAFVLGDALGTDGWRWRTLSPLSPALC